MNKIDIAKKVVKVVVCAGTSRVVAGFIENNTSPQKIHDKVAIASASLVLGSMVADLVGEYTDRKIDETVDAIQKIVAEAKEKFAKKEKEITTEPALELGTTPEMETE